MQSENDTSDETMSEGKHGSQQTSPIDSVRDLLGDQANFMPVSETTEVETSQPINLSMGDDLLGDGPGETSTDQALSGILDDMTIEHPDVERERREEAPSPPEEMDVEEDFADTDEEDPSPPEGMNFLDNLITSSHALPYNAPTYTEEAAAPPKSMDVVDNLINNDDPLPYAVQTGPNTMTEEERVLEQERFQRMQDNNNGVGVEVESSWLHEADPVVADPIDEAEIWAVIRDFDDYIATAEQQETIHRANRLEAVARRSEIRARRRRLQVIQERLHQNRDRLAPALSTRAQRRAHAQTAIRIEEADQYLERMEQSIPLSEEEATLMHDLPYRPRAGSDVSPDVGEIPGMMSFDGASDVPEALEIFKDAQEGSFHVAYCRPDPALEGPEPENLPQPLMNDLFHINNELKDIVSFDGDGSNTDANNSELEPETHLIMSQFDGADDRPDSPGVDFSTIPLPPRDYASTDLPYLPTEEQSGAAGTGNSQAQFLPPQAIMQLHTAQGEFTNIDPTLVEPLGTAIAPGEALHVGPQPTYEDLVIRNRELEQLIANQGLQEMQEPRPQMTEEVHRMYDDNAQWLSTVQELETVEGTLDPLEGTQEPLEGTQQYQYPSPPLPGQVPTLPYFLQVQSGMIARQAKADDQAQGLAPDDPEWEAKAFNLLDNHTSGAPINPALFGQANHDPLHPLGINDPSIVPFLDDDTVPMEVDENGINRDIPSWQPIRGLNPPLRAASLNNMPREGPLVDPTNPIPHDIRQIVAMINRPPNEAFDGALLKRDWYRKAFPDHFTLAGKIKNRSALMDYGPYQLGIDPQYWEWLTLHRQLMTRDTTIQPPKLLTCHEAKEEHQTHSIRVVACAANYGNLHNEGFNCCDNCRNRFMKSVRWELQKVIEDSTHLPICWGCTENLVPNMDAAMVCTCLDDLEEICCTCIGFKLNYMQQKLEENRRLCIQQRPSPYGGWQYVFGCYCGRELDGPDVFRRCAACGLYKVVEQKPDEASSSD